MTIKTLNDLAYIGSNSHRVHFNALVVQKLRLVFGGHWIRRLSVCDDDHDLCCVCSGAMLWLEAVFTDKLKSV